MALNFGLPLEPCAEWQCWRNALQFDTTAITSGEWWRLITFNLVHWDTRHFILNFVVFLWLGLMYERVLGRWYPWLLLAAGVGGGLAMLVIAPQQHWRGLSGVIAGLLLVVLGMEWAHSRRTPAHRALVVLAGILTLLWLLHKWYALPSARE